MKPKYLAMLATICATSCASPSAAADKPSETSAPPAFTWAGLHIGLNAGGGVPVASGGTLEAGSGFASRAFDLPAPIATAPARASARRSAMTGSTAPLSMVSRPI